MRLHFEAFRCQIEQGSRIIYVLAKPFGVSDLSFRDIDAG
jgi:hypothetical protein